MANDPNKGWRDGVIEQFESRVPPILKTDGKPCIPVSQFWSHTQESGKNSPTVSPFQVCSEGDVFFTQEKTENKSESGPEPLTGLALFALITTKQMSVAGGFLFFVVLALYFIFRKPRPSRKLAKKLDARNQITNSAYDDIGVEAGGVPSPIMDINVDGQKKSRRK